VKNFTTIQTKNLQTWDTPERKISSVHDGKISFERKMLSRNSANGNMWSSAVVVSV